MTLFLVAGAQAYQLPTVPRVGATVGRQRHAVPLMEAEEPFATIIFLRHGQSVWNEASLFTGWCAALEPACTKQNPRHPHTADVTTRGPHSMFLRGRCDGAPWPGGRRADDARQERGGAGRNTDVARGHQGRRRVHESAQAGAAGTAPPELAGLNPTDAPTACRFCPRHRPLSRRAPPRRPLTRQTLGIVLKITGQEDVPVHQNWRLNERMYGGLTGA
eukprot:3251657-Prymnesium_polylepis.3